MAWSDQIGAYCERLAPGLAGEPLNALSNVAFFAAAIALLRLHRRLRNRGEAIPPDVRALPWLMGCIAVCSLLFHTLSTRWAGWLDSFSILLYCCVCVFSFLRQGTLASNAVAALGAVAFAVVSFAASRSAPPATLNGSLAYLPNLFVLLAVTAYLGLRRARALRSFVLASVVFAIALILRTLDLAWCSALPVGTHFLWHLLAGLLVWLVGTELTLRRFRASSD